MCPPLFGEFLFLVLCLLPVPGFADNAMDVAETCEARKSNNEANELHAPLLDIPSCKSTQRSAFDLLMEMLYPADSVVQDLDDIVVLC